MGRLVLSKMNAAGPRAGCIEIRVEFNGGNRRVVSLGDNVACQPGVIRLPDSEWMLYPPPARLTPTWTPDIWPDVLLLMNACAKHGVTFQWSLGVLFIPLQDIEVAMSDLPSHIRVNGFDTFKLEGYRVYPRLDYMADFGSGIPVAEALAAIADWPRDMELWVEAVITDEHRN